VVVAIWTQVRGTPWSIRARRRSPPWTSVNLLDPGLDARDKCRTVVGDVLDTVDDLLVSDKFGLNVASILSVFTKFKF
jgi:hypothetical protein